MVMTNMNFVMDVSQQIRDQSCFWDFYVSHALTLLDKAFHTISFGGVVNPTLGVGVPTPYQKMAITPKINYPKEPKLCDFFYISMTNPPIPFWVFLPISGS